ncbi:hypothetical protein [Acetomicrobium flavidum]|uniref:hypothetical protein n=1 Tax=Acetomicrobium flavidum TaxID=49896 RepID=UPI0011784C27
MAKSLEPTQHPIEANSCPAEEIFVITKAKDGEASTTKWGSGQGLLGTALRGFVVSFFRYYGSEQLV